MTKKMLIDATHEEETRVAIVDNGRLEEFDYESAFRKPLKGNIYLAKVTRVEPSLQAAFVNYGGNRHGFLPFSEIHPDYFRIPISDREALMAEQEAALQEMAQAEAEEEAKDQAENGNAEKDDAKASDNIDEADDDDTVLELGGDQDEEAQDQDQDQDQDEDQDEDESEDVVNGNLILPEDAEDDVNGNTVEDDAEQDVDGNKQGDSENKNSRNNRGRAGRGRRGGRGRNAAHRSKRSEAFEDMDEEQRFRFNLRRKYKIQEVIKRGQIMLIQVSKEERGNKGAAVSSYLSLPGRYCVLMPNSPRAGGVSRKISNYKDRSKMRDMMKELEVPKGMSVILRTAGVTRTKTEVKRDLDYLLRLWNNIRELTLESSAPALVYEEADLIKRSVRDHYTRDIAEIQVAGQTGYKTAKDFMKMLIPSHSKRVVEYTDTETPLFNKFRIEEQIADIGETTVTLKSGGYLIINPTEALVSIDVNSGKATKERHIEETALKTNLEAAEEVARQLRLRDLGGLVVIDFIDMEDRRNNSKVERKMREALSGDKARIQIGKISSFGLMEMSRQRMSASLGETQFETCKHCAGTGRVRTADAATILILRDIENEGQKGRAAEVIVHVSSDVALYILNNKRQNISDLEARYDMAVVIRVDDSLGASCRVEVSKPKNKKGSKGSDDSADEGEAESANTNESSDNDDDNKDGNSSRRRRGRRGGRRRNNRNNADNQNENADDQSAESKEADPKSDESTQTKITDEGKDEKPKKKSTRKAKAKDNDALDAEKDEKPKAKAKSKSKSKAKDTEKSDEPASKEKFEEKSEDKVEEKPKRTRKSSGAKAKDAEKKEEAAKEEKPAKSEGAKKSAKAKKVKASNDDKPAEPEAKDYEKVNEAPKAKKKGWWNKLTD